MKQQLWINVPWSLTVSITTKLLYYSIAPLEYAAYCTPSPNRPTSCINHTTGFPSPKFPVWRQLLPLRNKQPNSTPLISPLLFSAFSLISSPAPARSSILLRRQGTDSWFTTILCTVIYMYYPFRFFISLMDQLNCMHVKWGVETEQIDSIELTHSSLEGSIDENKITLTPVPSPIPMSEWVSESISGGR